MLGKFKAFKNACPPPSSKGCEEKGKTEDMGRAIEEGKENIRRKKLKTDNNTLINETQHPEEIEK